MSRKLAAAGFVLGLLLVACSAPEEEQTTSTVEKRETDTQEVWAPRKSVPQIKNLDEVGRVVRADVDQVRRAIVNFHVDTAGRVTRVWVPKDSLSLGAAVDSAVAVHIKKFEFEPGRTWPGGDPKAMEMGYAIEVHPKDQP
jgi:hypothetical protein